MDNQLMVFILLLMASNKTEESSIWKALGHFLSTMEVDSQYTLEKIDILKKVGPYFPEEYIPLINKSISIAEGFLKFNQLIDLLEHKDNDYITETIHVKTEKERLSKIIGTVQKEAGEFENNNYGMVMDLIVNMDKYKSMFNNLDSIINKPEALKN